MIQTSSVLHPNNEEFDANDKAQLREFVDSGGEDYDKLITAAENNLHEAKRHVTRAEHELRRLKNHRDALIRFSKKHKLEEK